MSRYDELVKALRHCVSDKNGVTKCDGCPYYPDITGCMDRLHTDAAAAIEKLYNDCQVITALKDNVEREKLHLQARIEALEEDNADLNETVSSLIGMLKSFGEEPIQVGKAGNKYTLNEPKRGEIVRCKECRWGHLCVMGQHLGLDGFCSKGEREAQDG